MSTATSNPEGWYPDSDSGGTKYWDGARWTGDKRPPRKRFAAASGHKIWAVVLIVIGALSILGSPSSFSGAKPSGVGGLVVAIVVGAGLLAWGVYLLRGQGPSSRSVAEKAHATIDFERAIEALSNETRKSEKPGAALVTAYLVTVAAAGRRFGAATAPTELASAFASIDFDPATVSSPLVGQIGSLAVYKDWVISGSTAYDITSDTRAQFHLDDRVQTVTTSKTQGRKVVSTATEVPRGGRLQLVMNSGAQTFPVGPGQVDQARTLAEQINLRADQLRDAASSAAHGRATAEAARVQAIANPETAQALQNLQNLLFTRVISDDEFSRMKAKLLGDSELSS